MSYIGRVVNIQHFSVNDGEGLRTTVFLEGCPLKCKWCSNPDSWNNIVKLGVIKDKCKSCNKCIEVCDKNITSLLNRKEVKSKCNLCGKCVSNCVNNAISIMTKEMTVDEVVREVEKDRIFYINSGGGVTFSGGEATLQSDFLTKLVNKCYDKGINMAIETCGYFDFDKVKNIIEKLDYIFVDIKSMDDNIHKKYTGVSNKLIFENICKMARMNIPMTVRIPVISGVNDSIENIRNTAIFVKENTINGSIELLPYHKFGIEKYKALGLEDFIYEFKTPEDSLMLKLKKTIEDIGVKVVKY